MRYEIQRLSRDRLEAWVERLALIDRDTIGERWERSHFAVDLPGKWECSWVALEERRPVGFVVASDKGDSLHVHRIAVDPSMRGAGLGPRLLERVAECAAERGIPNVTLRVAARNEGAVRFYRRLGFHRRGPDPDLLDLSIDVDTLHDACLEGTDGGEARTDGRAKVLLVCAVDISAAKLLSAQVRALEEAGFEVHIACADGPHVPSLVEQGYVIQTIDIANQARPLDNLRSIFGLYRLMRRERYKVVHVHMISAAFLGRIAAALARVPFVFYTFRGFAFYEGSPRRLKLFNLLIERTCSPLTDFFFCQSEENRRRAIRHRVVPADRSVTIGNGIPVEEFSFDPEEESRQARAVREELGIPPEVPVVGFVGRLVKEKGLFELIEAAAAVTETVPNAVFLVIGEALASDVGVQGELEDSVRSKGLASRFVWTGYREDVSRLYRAMDVFVLPSYREGMPRSVMEAMASGKPVVATDIAGCRDQVEDGVTGLLVPLHDPDALGEAIGRLLRDPALARSMGRAGRKRAEALFDEREVCERIVGSYRDLLFRSEGVTRSRDRAGWPPYRTKPVAALAKGILDYSAATAGLLVLAPLFLLVAAAIKLDSPGPAFYRQTREGRFGRPFRIFKFRTMQKGADRLGLEISRDDQRITRVGRILRLTSIDELPQLINILRGEMSLVGPRPLLPGTTRLDEARRLAMKPGITSYPALFGRHALEWEERMPLDLWYIDHWSLTLDLRILLRTIPIVLSARDVYDPTGGSRMRSAEAAARMEESRT